MLFTLSAISLRPGTKGKGPVGELLEVPAFASGELDMRGLNVQTSLLSGWDHKQLDRLRDEADKAACPCLLLIEEKPHQLAHADDERAAKSEDRLGRVINVAHRLGCSGVVIGVEDSKGEAAVQRAAERIKKLVSRAERMEINLLIASNPGMTETPEQLTTLIRSIGGFRIGSFPDFEIAAKTDDPDSYLRALTPYATAVCAATTKFNAKGEHIGFDLKKCVESIRSVGYDGTLSLEYRGEDDPVAALAATKAAMEEILEASEK